MRFRSQQWQVTLSSNNRKSGGYTSRRKGGSNQGSNSLSVDDYDKVAITLLSRKLNISISTAYEWKRKAMQAGFIIVRSHYKTLDIAPYYKNLVMKALPEYRNILRIHNRRLCIQQPDEVIPKIRFAKWKKIETMK